MDLYQEFHGPNAGFVLDLYERFIQDPASVDAETRAVFEQWTPSRDGVPPPIAQVTTVPAAPGGEASPPQKVAAATSLAHSIRKYGHLAAQLDPLGSPPPGDPWLDLNTYGLTETDLQQIPASIVGGPAAEEAQNAQEAVQALREIYCKRTGYDYGHVRLPEEREWLRQMAECGQFRPPADPIDERALLDRLTQIEAFEGFLHRVFPGKTRFSIEGVDMLVPMLDDLVGSAAEANLCSMIIGMAHRGRLNVLAHILGKPYSQILAEFRDPVRRFPTREELGWTGDVKYHKGARHAIEGGEQVLIVIGMPPNPSHLEHVNPVVVGMARGAGSKTNRPGPPEFFTDASLPVLIHGDASFPGQGIVAETLNFSRLPGYWVGGALHIIANNQLGYTTDTQASRSTLYASDLAKGFQIPILHVNADDPVACLEAIRTAFAYRQKFKKDFLIDLVGYRRYGHNEGDEPSFTQPRMYDLIANQPTVRKQWGDELIRRGRIDKGEPEALVQARMKVLQETLDGLEPNAVISEPPLEPPPRGAARHVQTGVPLERLRELNAALLHLPEDFHLHRKLDRAMQRRREIFADPDAPTIDWASAEELAFASILADGISIRLTGEDVERGTFSQRHAVFHDTETGRTHTPLQALPQARAAFEVLNSALSENAAIGFEFGYNIQAPDRLVLWEAQYGDFINSAQAIIDEFVVSARAKWEQTPSLVLLLPHGYEGQGPDHSSGRPERFLQMASRYNLRLANCTTSAQYFHLLRRQAALLQTDPLPLIVLTPKSLLRHPLVASSPRRLSEGSWQPVIDDDYASRQPDDVRRALLCSGKIFVDLVSDGDRKEHPDVALIRVEQIYRFPIPELQPILERYSNLQEVVWVQEEPENMGAWPFVKDCLLELIGDRWPLRHLARPASSSPSEGSSAWHAANQKALVRAAFAAEPVGFTKEG